MLQLSQVGWGICGWLTSHWPAKLFDWFTSQSHLDQSRKSETEDPNLSFYKAINELFVVRIISKFSIKDYPECRTTICICWNNFKFLEILLTLRKMCHFSVSRSDIFGWSCDWSTIQFSQFTGQSSVKPMLPIPHPTPYATSLISHLTFGCRGIWN